MNKIFSQSDLKRPLLSSGFFNAILYQQEKKRCYRETFFELVCSMGYLLGRLEPLGDLFDLSSEFQKLS